MMGTTMSLRRYAPAVVDWKSQEIVVDKEFIAKHGLTIPVEHTFEPGLGLIEVYLQGQLLLSGGGYEELDDNSIRLDLGLNDEGTGKQQLNEGDEVYIKVYHNQYNSRGGIIASGSELYDLKKGIHDVKTYLEIEHLSTVTTTIEQRFNKLRDEFEFEEFGDYEVDYTYNSIGKIQTETYTKGNGNIRTFTYSDTSGKIVSERYEKEGKAITKEYFYNAAGKIERVKVRNTY